MRQDLGAIPNTVPPQHMVSIPGVPSKILKRREIASVQEPLEPVHEQVDDTSEHEERTSEVQRPAEHAPVVEGAVRRTNATYRQWTCEEMFREVHGGIEACGTIR